MSKKFYVVWKGAKTGVFTTWSEVQRHTQGRSDAQFMGFPSKSEAEGAFASTYTKALMKRSLANKSDSNVNTKVTSHLQLKNQITARLQLSIAQRIQNNSC